jgi:hypothetical protein
MSTIFGRVARRHAVLVIALAVLVGVSVAALARWSAGSSCPAYEDPLVTPCADLVASLSARIGAMAAGSVVFLDVLRAALLRTFRAMAEDHRAAREDAG